MNNVNLKVLFDKAEEQPENVGAAVVALVACFVWFLFAGFGFLVSVGLCLLLILIALLGNGGTLGWSFVAAALLKIFEPVLREPVFIWFPTPQAHQLMSWVHRTELWHLTWCIFIPLFALHAITRSVRLFR